MPGRDISILIIGANGLIGKALMCFLPRDGLKVVGTMRKTSNYVYNNTITYDLRVDIDSVIELGDFDWCILCAAETSIQQCEAMKHNSLLINLDRTLDLIDKCFSSGVKVIFFSSDHVFDGSKMFHSISDSPNPIIIGKNKLRVEKHIVKYGVDMSCIVRLTKVISKDTPIIQTWTRQILEGESIRPYTNKFLSPLPIQR